MNKKVEQVVAEGIILPQVIIQGVSEYGNGTVPKIGDAEVVKENRKTFYPAVVMDVRDPVELEGNL